MASTPRASGRRLPPMRRSQRRCSAPSNRSETCMFKVRYSYLPQQFADPSEILDELRRFVPTGDFTLGKPVAEFERRFAELIGTKHAIGVGSGSDSLRSEERRVGKECRS